MLKILLFFYLILLPILSGATSDVKYFRTEDDFLKGVEITEKQLGWKPYLTVYYDAAGRVIKIEHYKRKRKLLTFEEFGYDSTTEELAQKIVYDNSNNLIKKIIFGPEENLSIKYIKYVYGIDKVLDFGDRYTELKYIGDRPSAVLFYDVNSYQYGELRYLYDANGDLRQEDWISKPDDQLFRRFLYSYYPEDGITELWEYNSTLVQVAHLKLTPEKNALLFAVDFPVDSSFINTSSVTYSLTENLISGTITWEWEGGNPDLFAPHIVSLNSSEMKEDTYNMLQLTDAPNLMDGATYNITFSGVGKSEYPSVDITIKHVNYDLVPPEYFISADSVVNKPILSYTLNENLYKGEFLWKWTGGTEDTLAPYRFTISSGLVNVGEHNNILFSDELPLQDGSVYSIEFRGEDFAGNTGSLAKLNRVRFDTSPPEILSISPHDMGYVNNNRISYQLSENLASGKVIWYRLDDELDTISTHVADFASNELKAGVHNQIQFEDAPELIEGSVYDLEWLVVDYAGNLSDTVRINHIIYDTTAPVLAVVKPASNAVVNQSSVVYSLSENMSEVIIEWDGAEPEVEDTLISISLQGSYLEKGENLTLDPESMPELKDGVRYNITLTGSDLAGNEAISSTISFVLYDVTPPRITELYPIDSTYINSNEISYTLSETSVEGTVIWMQTAGKFDRKSPHIINLENNDLVKGRHESIQLSRYTDLQDSSSYQVMLVVADAAGNVSEQKVISAVTFDTSPPELEILSPDHDIAVSSTVVTWETTEDLDSAVIFWEWVDGIFDIYAPHKLYIPEKGLLKGEHEEDDLSLDLLEGAVYNIYITGIDKAGNQATSDSVNNIIFDETSPVISGFTPVDSTFVNSFEITYELSEQLVKGSIIWERMGGKQDPLAPHISQLKGNELSGGYHEKVQLRNPPILNDGSVYQVTMSGEDRAGNISDPITASYVTYDVTKPEFEVRYPDAFTPMPKTIISYNVIEDLVDGKVVYKWKGGSLDEKDHEVNLENEELKKGDHSEILFTDVGLMEGAIYDVIFTGTDAAGNESSKQVIPGVLFDATPPKFVDVLPNDSMVFRTPSVAYNLNESLENGIIIWQQTGGPKDRNSPHKMELVGEELLSGVHPLFNLTNTPVLQDSAQYTIKFVGMDGAGNVSDTVSIMNVRYDFSQPEIEVSYPLANNFTSSTEMSYILSENLAGAIVKWVWQSGEKDENAPHSFTLIEEERKKGKYDSISFVNSSKLIANAIYTIEFSGWDLAGNKAVPFIVPNIVYDPIPPEFTVTFPVDGMYVNHNKIEYSISEFLVNGSVTWKQIGGINDPESPHVAEFVGNELNKGVFALGELVNTPVLKDGSIYDVLFSGIDSAGNASELVKITHVTFDITKPEFSVQFPKASDYARTNKISYYLNENLKVGIISWVRTGGKEDSNSPYNISLVDEELIKGNHENTVLINSPNLMDGSEYELTFIGIDSAGNESEPIVIPDVIFDITPPVISVSFPSEGIHINDQLISYTLSETLKEGLVEWKGVSGVSDPKSPFLISLSDKELIEGSHPDVNLVNRVNPVEGAVYQIFMSGKDFAGNSSDTVFIDSVIYDFTPPEISISYPTFNAYIRSTTLSYNLSEDLGESSVTWIWTGGKSDFKAPYVVLLEENEREMGIHNNVTLTHSPNLVDGAVYSLVFWGKDVADNPAEKFEIKDINFDGTSPEITHAYPESHSFINKPVVSYVLNEALASGQYIWMTRSGDTGFTSIQEVQLTDEELATGTHTQIDLTKRLDLLDGVRYFIKVVGEDSAGNVSDTSFIENITYDITSPVITMNYPEDESSINNVEIGFAISEDLVSGKVIWTYISGMSDKNSPHRVNLEREKRGAGDHPKSNLLFPPELVEGAVYNLSMAGIDFAGNLSDTAMVKNLFYDVTKPEITIHSPLPHTAQNHLKISYSLTENLTQGEMIWQQTGGERDENFPHKQSMIGEALNAGDHTDFEVFPALSLLDGSIYRITMVGMDEAGNLSDSINVNDVLYDVTVPTYRIIHPSDEIVVNSTAMSYEFSETLEEVILTWERIKGFDDPSSPYTVFLSEDERLSGVHENIIPVNSPQLVNGAIYTLTFWGRDKAENSGEEMVIPNIRYDDEPPIITVTYPPSNSFINSSKLTYSLSENLKNGSVSWIWIGGTEDKQVPYKVNLVDTELDEGLHTDVVLTESSPLVEGTIYEIRFEGLDLARNEATPVIISEIKFDAEAPVITWEYPSDSSYINSLEISYSISEKLQKGTVIWEQIGGNKDPGTPHRVELMNDELESGIHDEFLPINSPYLIDGAIYSMRFTGVDLAGNEASSTAVNNILFDITPPEIVADYPAPGSTVNSSRLSYTLTERLGGATVTWTPSIDGREDVNSMVEIKMTSEMLSQGAHREVLLSPDLIGGTIYTIKISGVDLAGNPASGMVIESVTFDNEPPQLHVEIPGGMKVINEVRLTYSSNEILGSATMIWSRISGAEDEQSPHIVELVGKELNAGINSNVLLTNSPELQDGTHYSVSFQGKDLGDNESKSETIVDVLYDTTSPQISLTSPENDAYINKLNLSYSISENLKETELSWIRINGSEDPDSPHNILLEGDELKIGDYLNKVLTNQSNLVDGSIYQIRMIGKDLAGNASPEIVIENVHYDTTPPMLTDFSLTDGIYINRLNISYTLSENLSEGRMVWEKTGSHDDPGSPHTIVLTSEELSSGEHNNILLSNSPDLVSGSEYSIKVNGIDFAENSAKLATVEHVIYDTIQPVITLLEPVNQSYVNHSIITYNLSESLETGSIKWISQTNGSEIIRTLSIELLQSGEHKDIELSDSPQLVDGETYTIILEGRDKAGNGARIGEVGDITYDITPPIISIELPEPHTLVTDKVVSYTTNEDLSEATVSWIRESGASDDNAPHFFTLEKEFLKKGSYTDVKLEGFDAIQVGTIYTIIVQGFDLAKNESNRTTVRGIDMIQDLEGDWLYKGALITVVWSFRQGNEFSQGVMMGSRISNEEPGTYILDFATKPFKMEIDFESGIKRYAIFEFTGTNKLKVVTSTQRPDSWTDGDLMYFEKMESSVP